jgi:hypothetical protein
MIITDLDTPLTAEDARKISINNREDSVDRSCFRLLMQNIKYSASFGHTRFQTSPQTKERGPSEHVCDALRSMGYKVTIKRAYRYDSDKKEWSDKPLLDYQGREQFFAEITWG